AGLGGRGGRAGRGGGDAERGIIDPAEPLLLSAFNDSTKASGFYRDQLGVNKAPERIVMEDVAFGTPLKAADAEQFFVTNSTFVDFLNLCAVANLTILAEYSEDILQQKD